MKREVDEDVSVSLSVHPDPVTSNSGLTQSATDRAKYFEPQESSVGAASSGCTPVDTGDGEEKLIPVALSPSGLSCSPSTFHSSLPTASTSVLVPGTFTQKSSGEKVFDCLLHNCIKPYSLGCEGNTHLL